MKIVFQFEEKKGIRRKELVVKKLKQLFFPEAEEKFFQSKKGGYFLLECKESERK